MCSLCLVAHATSAWLDYYFDTNLHNCEVRGQLDHTKPRNQDVTLLVQDNLKRYVGLATSAVAESFVRRMFSTQRLPGQKTIKGYIAIASYVSSEILERMVGLPFEVPCWFWREHCEFIKLSGTSYGICVAAFGRITLPFVNVCCF